MCWADQQLPPFQHRPKQQNIPRTKEQLVTELMSMPENKHPPKALKRMYVIELRALWKTLNNVTPHPGNPLNRVSTLRKPEVKSRCQQHNLPVTDTMTIGSMLVMLRSHWETQCSLAMGLGYTSKTEKTRTAPESEGWEKIEPAMEVQPDQEVARTIYEQEEIARQALSRAAVMRQAQQMPPVPAPPMPKAKARTSP